MKLAKSLALGTCLYLFNTSTTMANLYWNGNPHAVSATKITKSSAYKKKLNRKMFKIRQQLGVSHSVSNNQIRDMLVQWANDQQSHQFSTSVSGIEHAITEVQKVTTQKMLEKMSSGKHSFRKLGREFYVACKMEKVPASEAKLVFFNQELAESLGLSLPKNPDKLEKMILDKFAVITDDCSENYHAIPGTMIATRYMDSSGKDPLLHAQGDGRAVWSGEIMANFNGKMKPLDVVLKGIGKTTLEWRGHDELSHKDGLQSTREGVHSYIISKINQKNEIDSTQDLAVIKLINRVKKDQKYGDQAPTITVRIGQQVRMGHLSYWADPNSPDKYKKILQYSVNRAINRSVYRNLTPETINKFLNLFVKNLATEAARYADLVAMHGSLTRGNRTTEGLSIDNGTWQYLDAYHADYPTVGGSNGKLQNQKGSIKDYIKDFFSYTKVGDPVFYNQISDLESKFNQLFDDIYEDSYLRMTLRRIGYTAENISRILTNDSLSGDAIALASELNRLTQKTEDFNNVTSEVSACGKDIYPARYDMRNILTNTVKFLKKYNLTEWEGCEMDVVGEIMKKNDLSSWFATSNSASSQEIAQGANSEIFKFAKQLDDFQRKLYSTLGISLKLSETKKLNGLKRPNEKTGTYILDQFKLVSDDLQNHQSNERLSKQIESKFVEKGLLLNSEIPNRSLPYAQLGDLNAQVSDLSIQLSDSSDDAGTGNQNGRVDSLKSGLFQ